MTEQRVVARGGSRVEDAAVTEFVGGLRGRVIGPADANYDEARTVMNGLIDRRPGLIVRPSGTADVVAAVNFARTHDLVLAVRGGGHNVAGNAVCDDGLVIDLSSMRAVYVDPAKRTARAQGGATWGDLDRETQLHGLATPGGAVSTTGIAGLTLHGGMGHLRSKHGLSLDNLLSVEIVTADGQVRTASEHEHADLFWAVRGAGSNFGVITSMEFRLHPVGPLVFLCAPIYALADGPTVVRAWRDFMASAPEEVSSIAIFWSVPPGFPPEAVGREVVIPAAVYAGPPDEGECVTKPLRELAMPLLDLSHTGPFVEIQSAFDPFFPKGLLQYWTSLNVDTVSDELIDEVCRLAAERPSPRSDLGIWHHGPAMHRVDASATAFGRRSQFLIPLEATWESPEDTDRNIAWAKAGRDALRRFVADDGIYLNFPGDGSGGERLVRAGYGNANYERLAALKATYDPTNVFRNNFNIAPVAVR
jgi:hypothetical protein